MTQKMVSLYPIIKEVVRLEGYSKEISWQQNIDFGKMNEGAFIKELAWVILSSGMKEQTIRNVFSKLTPIFNNWQSAKMIHEQREDCYFKALRIFNHPGKISAIIDSIEVINSIGYNRLKRRIRRSPLETLQRFPYIGPVTVFHLAKNIGVQVAKPDRHLVRIAQSDGYDDVQDFCRNISKVHGDSVPVVDIVLWRFANIEPNYLSVLRTWG
jgi:hypothetical protein